MSQGTAASFRSSSTRLVEQLIMSLEPRSTSSFGASQGSGEDDTVLLCQCGRSFKRRYPEQSSCLRCRAIQLTNDSRRGDTAELERLQALFMREAHEGDWQLVDETGRLVWARDLRKRYLEETRPRPVRNNLRKWL